MAYLLVFDWTPRRGSFVGEFDPGTSLDLSLPAGDAQVDASSNSNAVSAGTFVDPGSLD